MIFIAVVTQIILFLILFSIWGGNSRPDNYFRLWNDQTETLKNSPFNNSVSYLLKYHYFWLKLVQKWFIHKLKVTLFSFLNLTITLIDKILSHKTIFKLFPRQSHLILPFSLHKIEPEPINEYIFLQLIHQQRIQVFLMLLFNILTYLTLQIIYINHRIIVLPKQLLPLLCQRLGVIGVVDILGWFGVG